MKDLAQPLATLALAAAIAFHAVQPATAQTPETAKPAQPTCEFVVLNTDAYTMGQSLLELSKRHSSREKGFIFPQRTMDRVTGYHFCTW